MDTGRWQEQADSRPRTRAILLRGKEEEDVEIGRHVYMPE